MTANSARKPLLNDHHRGRSSGSYQSLVENPPRHLGDRKQELNTLGMVMLTVCMAGIQFTWTVELGYGSPYLISLGLSKNLTALVWLAGPLSGLIIQPVVGALSDKSTFRMGRRRPYILVGGLLVSCSMVAIAYAKEWAELIVAHHNEFTHQFDDQVRTMAIWIAVSAFYFLDFSLNAVMASCRALILDIPPMWQQETSNAWAARMIHFGNIVGYFAGFVDYERYTSMTQLQVLCSIAILLLVLSLLATSLYVKEDVYEPVDGDDMPWHHTLAYIFRAVRHLPIPVRRVCNVQFFAWMGWFPFLFYSTTWIGDIYRSEHPDDPDPTLEGMRMGSFALLMYSFVSAAAGITLPYLTPTTYPTRNPFTIVNIYTVSHVLFAIAMVATFLVANVYHAMAIIAFLGIPWAVSMWVPYALVGEYVSQQDDAAVAENTEVKRTTPSAKLDTERLPDDDDLIVAGPSSSASDDTVRHDEVPDKLEEEEFDAGTILGIHNMYIVLPQFVVALVSSAIFKLASEVVGDSASDVAWVLRFSGLMAIVAAVLSRYIIDMHITRAP